MINIAIPQMGNDLFRKYMKSKYVSSLNRSGANAVWIELDNPQKAVEDALKCDGMLLPGGADVNPTLYGEEPIKACGKPNNTRDNAEPLILKAFLDAGKPVFAICRGIQIMNVVLGGTLIQDIKAQQTVNHSDFLNRAKFTHNANISEKSKLFEIIGKSEIKVNSMHHQAIKELGNGLISVATSIDGFIEAVELENHGFCVGVQWHPEHMSKKNNDQQKLFNAFVNACENTVDK